MHGPRGKLLRVRCPDRRIVRCVSEALEQRMLLSLSAAGGEFRVNAFTTGNQSTPAVAVDGDGDFVVAWHGAGSGDANYGVFAQRFNASGVAQGSAFLVNTFTTSFQGSPAIAIDADGDFVITWTGYGPAGAAPGIYARRFNAAGVAQSSIEFRVNTLAGFGNDRPAVAMDAAGDFVIAFQSYGQDGSFSGVSARRYDFLGRPQGGEFVVNTYTTSEQFSPTVAMDATGDFVVAWSSTTQFGIGYGSYYDVYAQRYNAAGAKQGGEFRVNTTTVNPQVTPAVAMDVAGDFVIAWTDGLPPAGQDGSGYGVFAQRYNAAGVAQGGEFQVNTYTTDSQTVPKIAMDARGDFLVTWVSYGQDGALRGVYAKEFNAAGAALGAGEFRVNSYTTLNQSQPAVAMDPAGDAAIVWASFYQDNSNYGVYAQRYHESVDSAGPLIAGIFVNGSQATQYGVSTGPVTQLLVSFSENVSDAGGAAGANSVTNPNNWRISYKNGSVPTAVSITSISYLFNAARNRFEATINLNGSFSLGSLQVTALDTIRDVNNNALDGNLDGVSGGNMVLTFALGVYGSHFSDLQVNTFTGNDQTESAVAMDAAGDFVAVWSSVGQDGSAKGIYGQRFNAAGIAQGAEFHVNQYTTGDQLDPQVAMDGAGNFVVVWDSALQDGSTGQSVYARLYNAAGAALGSEFRVNTFTTAYQLNASVAMDANGDFVVTWESYPQDGNGNGVYAQRFNAAGIAQGSEFKVNTYTTNEQMDSSVAMDAAGDFVVTWQSTLQDGSGTGVYAQRFNAAGTAQGAEFKVNIVVAGDQDDPHVAMDAAGNFVIVWMTDNDGASRGIKAQRYTAAGVGQGEFLVNTFTTGLQSFPAIAMDASGDFVALWQSSGQTGSYNIYAQRYTAAGVKVGGETLVNTTFAAAHIECAVAMVASDNFISTWSNAAQDGSGFGIFRQHYFLGAVPTVASLSDIPDPVVPGNSTTLTASGIVDDAITIINVQFYRESNGIAGLQFGAGGDTLVGTDTNGADGYAIAASTTGLAAGTYTYYAQATDSEGFVGPPATTQNTVMGSAPTVTASNFLFLTAPLRLTFTFDQNVSASLSLADITIQDLTHSTTVTPSSLNYNTGTNTATVNFSGLLADANYRATLSGAGITNPGGTPMASDYPFDFFFLNGDANRDRHVDVTDLGILATNWQGTGTFSQADFNLDGQIDVTDLGILATNWQKGLLAPSPASSLPVATAKAAAKTRSDRKFLIQEILN